MHVAIVVVAWCLSLAATYWWAYASGRDAEIAAHAREQDAAQRATEVAARAAADAISKIKIQHRTVQQEVQREISERVVYRECQHTAEQLQRINAALTGGGTEPAGRGLVPRADAALGPEFRRDDGQVDRGGGAVP